MPLTLFMHPLASYCQKVIVALYEKGISFDPHIVDLSKEDERNALKKLWRLAKFPVLRDEANGFTVAESSVVIEYLDLHYPGKLQLIPADPERAWQTRMRDRFFDLHMNDPMARIVANRNRPQSSRDPYGVKEAQRALTTAYEMLDAEMAARTWAMGDAFTMADCAAAPALFYANKVLPFEATYTHAAAYYARLLARPSFARVLVEAEPYLKFFPQPVSCEQRDST